MIAGGFGTGAPESNVAQEIAPVVPYRGGRKAEWNEEISRSDAEAQEIAELPVTMGQSQAESAPILPLETPFFHFDLASAVRAASAPGKPISRQDTIFKGAE